LRERNEGTVFGEVGAGAIGLGHQDFVVRGEGFEAAGAAGGLAGHGESEQLAARDEGGTSGAKFGTGRFDRGERIGGFLKGAEREGGVGLGGDGELGAGGVGAGRAATAVEQRDGDLRGDKAAERTGAQKFAEAPAGEKALRRGLRRRGTVARRGGRQRRADRDGGRARRW
jgi:hypothetical protein